MSDYSQPEADGPIKRRKKFLGSETKPKESAPLDASNPTDIAKDPESKAKKFIKGFGSVI